VPVGWGGRGPGRSAVVMCGPLASSIASCGATSPPFGSLLSSEPHMTITVASNGEAMS
jgi:hypothetical protein